VGRHADLLEGVPGRSALELLAHRIVWSIPVLVVVLALRGRWRSLLIDFSRTRDGTVPSQPKHQCTWWAFGVG